MSGMWGKNVRFSIFGESHGEAIGIVIDGLPSGIKLDLEEIKRELARRAPGNSELATPRKENDYFDILSGYFNNYTTGTPLCIIIKNNNTISKDYASHKSNMRPSHADFTGNIKYKGFNDYRGGGHFSGRITAPLVFAGAVAKQILSSFGISIGAHIYSIENVYDTPFNPCDIDNSLLSRLSTMEMPVINKDAAEKMKYAILAAKSQGDSVGGIVETSIIGLPAGIGDPFFNSIESCLSQLLFSVPAVKAVEFGAGFNISKIRGSEANDIPYIQNDTVRTRTNNNGGVLGGISNGMPIVFRCALKPTPSISIMQESVNIDTKENVNIEIKGRHDPCIVVRAVPVIEAAAAIGILDLMMVSRN
jgi:chorismate synthase